MVEQRVVSLGQAAEMPYTVERQSGGVSPEVEQFWYSVYVHEMGLTLPSADHERQRIHDPFAEFGHVLVARDDEGLVVGTLLAVLGFESSLGYYKDLYDLSEDCSKVSITSKILIAESARQSRLVFYLATEAFRWGTSQGILTDYCDCQRRTLPLFRRLGYRKMRGRIEHPIYGESLRMRMDCHDHAHLVASGSPFAQ